MMEELGKMDGLGFSIYVATFANRTVHYQSSPEQSFSLGSRVDASSVHLTFTGAM